MTVIAEAPPTDKPMSMAVALNSALDEALTLDPRVLLLGEDIADPAGGVFKITRGLSSKHGTERVRATPIAEQSIIGASIGAAMGGYRPVAEIMFFDFMTVCMDQVVNHAAKLRFMSGGATPVPLTIRTTIGSSRFGAQHAQELEAWFMHTPGIKVVMPSSPADAKGLLLSCIFDPDPCLFIEHSSLLFAGKRPVPLGDHRVPLGVASVPRAGSDVTVITYGAQVPVALAAAEVLAGEGIDAEVIDLRSLVPLDWPTVFASVARTTRAIVVHNATRTCGPGAEIAARLTEELFTELAAPVVRLGAADVPVAFAPELSTYPTMDDIVGAARALR
jgi:pyruvate dehydrogenase E1 component beta subunit/2-oxoisovalerate dehydrogenase E1 component